MLKREEKAGLVSLVVVVGFTASVFFHYWMGYYRGSGYPQNTFLFIAGDARMDFFNTFNPARAGNLYSFPHVAYFPFTYLPLALLGFLPGRVVLALMFGAFTWAAVSLAYRRLGFLSRYERLSTTFILSFLTYPFLICVDRGNVECLVFVFLYLFFVNLERDNLKLGVFFLACATAMKLYPGVFVVLLWARKRHKAALGTIVLTALLTFLSAAVHDGGVLGTFRGQASNLRFFKQYYVLGDAGLRFNSSYYGLMKLVIGAVRPVSVERLDQLLLPYTLACLAAFALLSVYVIRRERVLWKSVSLLSFSMLLFPEVSFDYKLVYVWFPAIFFIAAPENEPGSALYSVLFGLLLIPKAFFWIKDDVSIGVVINPLLMTLIILLIVKDGLFRRADDSAGEPLLPTLEARG